MASIKNIRPAGLSDSGSDDDEWQSSSWKHHLKPVIQHASMLNDGSSPPQTPSTSTPKLFQPAATLNSKQRKSKKYWEKVKKAEQEDKTLPPVADPKCDPKNEDFFRFTKQVIVMNMGLVIRTDEDIMRVEKHKITVNQWKPHTYMTVPDVRMTLQLYAPSVKLMFVNDNTGFMLMLDDLRSEKELALDMECCDRHSYLGMICLVQISTRSSDYLIDIFPMFENIVKHLKPILEDESKLKILHGMQNDIKNLQRDFNIHLLAAVDTQLWHYGTIHNRQKQPIGYSALCKEAFGDFYKAPEDMTLKDWRRRPLTEPMIKYARDDSHTLLRLWQWIKRNGTPNSIQAAFESSKRLLQSTYSQKTQPSALQDLEKLNIMRPNNEVLELYELLHQFRNRFAAIFDDEPSNIIPTKKLLEIAQLRDYTTDELVAFLKSFLPLSFRKQIPCLVRLIMEKDEYMTRMQNCCCHNCLLKGHPALYCPFGNNKDRVKEYMNMSEHRDQKTAQNRRRRHNKQRNKLLSNPSQIQ